MTCCACNISPVIKSCFAFAPVELTDSSMYDAPDEVFLMIAPGAKPGVHAYAIDYR